MKLTAKAIKELAKLQPEVAALVKEYMTDYRTRRVSFEYKNAGFQMYLGEGCELTFFAPNGKQRSAAMLTDSTVGAASDGISHHVGQYTPALPEGTWIVEFQLFLGAPFITVYAVGLPGVMG